MLVYRIVHRKYSAGLFAPGLAGRWNRTGNKVIYTAESIPLAFLENMVRRQGVGFNNDFNIMIIEVPDTGLTENVSEADLKPGWRDFRDYSQCRPIGDRWYDEGKSLLLKVPSAVMPEACNYVINSEHKEFDRIKLAGVAGLVPDERVEDILKKYQAT